VRLSQVIGPDDDSKFDDVVDDSVTAIEVVKLDDPEFDDVPDGSLPLIF
jgi:hypothetical protein